VGPWPKSAPFICRESISGGLHTKHRAHDPMTLRP